MLERALRVWTPPFAGYALLETGRHAFRTHQATLMAVGDDALTYASWARTFVGTAGPT